jgi:5-methylthioadenosine/S-adenosylhomocysteine deaminase
MVNGAWLMRDRRLLTVDVPALQAEADALARKVDTFLIQREASVLSKLVAIGGVAQTQTFEIQVKVRCADLDALEARLLALPDLTVQRTSLRHQYDTYFLFNDSGKRASAIVRMKSSSWTRIIH